MQRVLHLCKVHNGDNWQPPIVPMLCKPQHGIVPKVKAALLGPNIWVYVKDIGEFIVVGFFFCVLVNLLTQLQQDMKIINNSKAWKIPSSVFEDPHAFKELKIKVKKILTNFCAEAKKAVSQAALFMSSLTNILPSSHNLSWRSSPYGMRCHL